MVQDGGLGPVYDMERFVGEIRRSIEVSSTSSELLRQVKGHLVCLLRNREFLHRDYGVPFPGDYRPRVLYKDREHSFAVHATIWEPKEHSPFHDHGPSWVVTGVHRNRIRTHGAERVDDGSVPERCELRRIEPSERGEGEVALLPPWGIHAEENPTAEPTVLVVVYAHDLSEIWRNVYDLERGTLKRVRSGPSMIPKAPSSKR